MCRATASRIGDRWYALGGWLQRSEINLQFKSVGVRARGSSDCRAASAAMISLNLDRFDNGEIESRSTAFRSSLLSSCVYSRGSWPESIFIDDGIPADVPHRSENLSIDIADFINQPCIFPRRFSFALRMHHTLGWNCFSFFFFFCKRNVRSCSDVYEGHTLRILKQT